MGRRGILVQGKVSMDIKAEPGCTSHSAPEEIYKLNWEQFSHYWKDIEPALKATDFYDYYDDDWLFNGVLKGEIQVFVLSDGQIKMVVFTHLVQYPKHKVVSCFWGFGREFDKFAALADARLEYIAHVCEADRIEIIGRPGWFRKMRPLGWRQGWCTVWRDVPPKRSH
jgi:hypothetical protein